MKFSIRLNNDHRLADYVKLARAAEAAGFDQFWVSDDLFLRSAPIILAAVAQATETIEVGTCILNPYTLNPAEMAMMAATLDELSGGRFNLGLSSGAGDFLGWIGIEQHYPRTAVIETVNVINQLLSGERASYQGKFIQWTDEAYLRFKPERRVPIYIGAMSPKMQGEIGAIADGGLPLLFPPESYASVLPYIQAGVERAGRDLDAVDVAACIWVSVGADKAAAEEVLREKIAYYGHAFSATILANLGLVHDDFREIEQAVQAENNIEKAMALVTDTMMQFGIAGDTKALIKRLETLAEMGAKHISFGPPLGPDLLDAIEQLGREVIPYFRQDEA